jgi:PST family polysaccharide transporter
MTLIKTSILSFITTLIKIITGLISVKVVAVYIGPAGTALIGQFNNFVSIINAFCSGGVNSGIVKYTAEYKNDIEAKKKLWSSSVFLFLLLIIPTALCIIILSKYLSQKLLKSGEYYSIFIIYAFSLVFYVAYGFIVAVLNGQKEIKKIISLNIFSAIFGLLITVLLVYKLRLYGALIAGIIAQSIVFFAAFFFIKNSSWFSFSLFTGGYDKKVINQLLKYSLMTLVSAFLGPVSQIYLRNYVASHFNWDMAGCWQAVCQISNVYLMIITTSISIYYLPRLSEISDKKELKKEISSTYKYLLPITIIMALGIFVLKDLIILIVFSEKFMPMRQLFLFQLIGDVFKIASWLLAYLMIAKAMARVFIISEIFFVSTLVILSVLFMNIYGFQGISIAYAVNYFLYAIFCLIYFTRYLNEKQCCQKEL